MCYINNILKIINDKISFEDISPITDPNSCLSDLSDSLKSLKSLNSMKILLHLVTTQKPLFLKINFKIFFSNLQAIVSVIKTEQSCFPILY